MKIRMHRGGYTESMKTLKEIPATMEAVRDYLATHGWPMEYATLKIEMYFPEYNRGWDCTYIIIVEGVGPAAFCDQPVN